MKILSTSQVYEADRFTIDKQEISSDALMERAALGIFEWMHQRLQGSSVRVHIFCGIGNNGGDGLALARLLKEEHYEMQVYVVNYSEKRSPDFLRNLDRVKDRKLWPAFLDENNVDIDVAPGDIVVDAIFGIGLNRAPAKWVREIIGQINGSSAFVLSVDIPSGLFMDRIPEFSDGVIKANYVLSFQTPKLPFFLPGTGHYLERWELLDIGLDREFMEVVETDYNFMVREVIAPMYSPRGKFTHKGTYGHAVIIGGSYGKIGAVALAARACLLSGAGLVSAFMPKCGYIPLQSNLPEAMVMTDANDLHITKIEVGFAPSAVGVGVGMGTDKETAMAFERFLDQAPSNLVIDADGLNLLAQNPSLLEKLPRNTILTPHPKELERLISPWKDDFEKLAKARAFAMKYNCIMVVKGAHSVVFSDQGVGHINSTGNPGMATAGSGDVLTGVLTGLLAQGYTPLCAALFGVFWHGFSGDVAASISGYEALTASRISDCLGEALNSMFRENHGDDR